MSENSPINMPLQTIRLATALFLVLTLARAQYVAVRVFPRAQNNTAIVDGGTGMDGFYLVPQTRSRFDRYIYECCRGHHHK